MTKAEAAAFLGVSERAIERYTKQSLIGVHYEKGRAKPTPSYDREELERFKAERERATYQPAKETPKATNPTQSDALALVSDTQGVALGKTETAPNVVQLLAALVESAREGPNATARSEAAHYDGARLGPKLLLTLPEVQAITGLSRATLREAIDAGALPAKQIGRGWKIKRADLERFIENL